MLVLNKPAGLVCHPSKGSVYSSLIGRARAHVGPRTSLHLVNRLDRETSGVILLAKSPATAGELGKIWERHGAEKEYLAIVHGHVEADTGVIDAPLGKDVASAVAIKDCVRPDGLPAHTKFTVERRLVCDGRPFTLLRIEPLTGRKHQIRIHLAYQGHPIVGDKIYGGDERIYLSFVRRQLTHAQERELIFPYQALHAVTLRFAWRDRIWNFQAPPEPWFSDFVVAASGG